MVRAKVALFTAVNRSHRHLGHPPAEPQDCRKEIIWITETRPNRVEVEL